MDAEIVRLAVWEELSHAEIAQIVGVDAALVRSRLYRGKQRLERSLQSRDIRSGPDTNRSTSWGDEDDEGQDGHR